MRQLRYIVSLVFAAGIVLHVSDEARAQDICDLGERVVEILSTIDACAATDSQLAELESVRQEILASNDDTECGDIEERIAQLELTIPRLSDRGPSTLEQPVPTCEANQEELPAATPKAMKRLSLRLEEPRRFGRRGWFRRYYSGPTRRSAPEGFYMGRPSGPRGWRY